MVGDKVPMLRQYMLTDWTCDDVADETPQATAGGARDAIWARHCTVDSRFRVTRAEVRQRWSEADEMECDQLVIVCDYAAKGANGADARTRIEKVLCDVGVG